MILRCTPEEYVASLEEQTLRAATLVEGLDVESLNWQPDGGKAWSVGQCVEHLCVANETVVPALRAAVEKNRAHLQRRTKAMEPAGWFSRSFISRMGPERKMKFPAPSNIVPQSRVQPGVASRFSVAQKLVTDFVGEYGQLELGSVRYKNPLVKVLNFTVDSGLLLMLNHNDRHLMQAELAKKERNSAG